MDPTRAGLRSRDFAVLGIDRRGRLPREWVTTSRGIHLPSAVAEDPGLAAIATAAAAMGEFNALGGWAALAVHGVRYFDVRDYGPKVLVHCLPGSRLRARPMITPFQGLVLPDELVGSEGFTTTTIARAAFDEMRMARSLDDAIVVADMASSRICGGGRTSLAAIEHVIGSHHKVRGIVRATEAIAWASERSASPWETRLRLRAVRDVGLKGVLVNAPVFDLAGGLLGVADLIDPANALVLESDGSQHREIDNHRDDNEREEKFEDAGLAVARFTAQDHADRWQLAARIERARRRGRSSTHRGWTLDAPPWWFEWEPGRRYR